MKSVKRFDLELEPAQTLSIPFNSEILMFGTWDEKPCMWILIEDGHALQRRTLKIFADGKEVPQRFNVTRYIGSFEAKAEVGKTMLHVFEE